MKMKKTIVKVFKLIKNILKVNSRNKGTYVVYLMLPIIGVAVSLGIYGTSGTKPLNLGVINNDGSQISKDLEKSLTKTGSFKIVSLEEESIDEKLLSGKLNCVVVIPEKFGESLFADNYKKIEITTLLRGVKQWYGWTII